MRFGRVMEVVIMYDQEKKKSRGFGFLSFEDEEAVERCVAEHFVNLSGKQVEIKKAEPRDSNKMNDGSGGNNQWGPPQGAAGHMAAMGGVSYNGMGMGTPSGQMGGPMGSMGPMAPGNMMQSYQTGWGSTPQTQAYPGQWGPSGQPPMNGYGTPSAPGGYQGWGGPPAHQGQQMGPPQWSGANYGAPPQQTGYGSYGDMYRGAGAGAGPTAAGPTPPGAGTAQKPASDYNYGAYANYTQDSTSYGGGRSYGAPDTSGQTTGEGYSDKLKDDPYQQGGDGYGGGVGPQRAYTAPSQAGYHPYRRA
ncbi:hypothetical protein LSTR_LSTR010712 [Laodelphax striatellus]|uniref:RRM domain-containing protein n=1 Tax=Laodelphax striatellus TaxID=195883 RepID=A0A482WYP0_LAOST|nr:hypothetical protein LSTR_LSTR010712 [Laodelphax striatellus]